MASSTIRYVPTRPTDLGGMTIRRVLPSRDRRLVGAWCFFDHAGPVELGATGAFRVGPHPHIGLSTFTWMIEGEILHRDSLGTVQTIRPGQVNLMTAGRGIAHSEESPMPPPARLHLAQLWIALPDAVREVEPSFEHFPSLPVIERDGFVCTLLVGETLGRRSPVPSHTPLLGMDLLAQAPAETTLPLRADFEYAIWVLEGEAEIGGERITNGTLVDLGLGHASVALRVADSARLLILGGEPFGEAPLLHWNFVGRTHEEIVEATRQWNAGERFGEVRGFDGPRLKAPEIPPGVRLSAKPNPA